MTDFAFLHGGGQGGWVWEATIAALALQARAAGEDHRMLALDAPGCGTKRDRAVADLSMDDVAAELVADIEAAGLSDVVLVGHSQAGQALPAMARLRPGLLRRLVHVSCSIPLPGQSVSQLMGTGRQGENDEEVGWPFDPNHTSIREGFPLMFCNDMTPAEAASFAAKLGKDAWPPLTYAMTDWAYDGIGTVPASYVLCLRDNILPPSWQERFAARFGAERVSRIDAGHQVMNTRPHALAEVLRREAAT